MAGHRLYRLIVIVPTDNLINVRNETKALPNVAVEQSLLIVANKLRS